MKKILTIMGVFTSALLLNGCSQSTSPSSELAGLRDQYAEIVEKNAVKVGKIPGSALDFTKTNAVAGGDDKTTLTIENADFTPELARMFAKQMFADNKIVLDKAREFKFVSVVFTNGTTSWPMDVQKGDWQSVGS